MKNFLSLFILFLCASVYTKSHAQSEKIRYGKVSGNEMRMEYYPKDSTAEAVILSDIGRFNSQNFEFSRHLRVKILKKSGLDWANWTFDVPSRGAISGIVFNLENGEPIKEKLKPSSIHEEEIVEDYVVYKVFMPNVRVGSVIDIKYVFTGMPFEWRFQERIPVAHSELVIEKSPYVNYSLNSFGFEPVQSLSQGVHWVAKDMPAFKSEPYLSDYSNYITKFEIDLQSVTIPGYYREYTTSWGQVNEYLVKHDYIGKITAGQGYLNEFAKSIKALNLSKEEVIDTAYHYIQENIKWNNFSTIYATGAIRAHFMNDHLGNSAEINLLLINLLKKLDIQVQAVALSTRDNGILSFVTPSISKLNYIIAYVKDGDVEMFLDATDDKLPAGVLPERCINGRGRIFSEGFSEWIDLNPNSKFASQTMITVTQNDGDYKASVLRKYSGYSYFRWKKKYDNSGSESKYKASIEESFPGFTVEEYKNTIDQKKLLVKEVIAADVTELVDDFGQESHIPLSIFMDMDNPFKAPERKYPVDFVLPFTDQVTYVLNFGEEYGVGSVPEPVRMSLPEKAGSFLFICSPTANNVQVQCKLTVNKALFTETEYAYLKQFYSIFLNKMGESIQLIKKT